MVIFDEAHNIAGFCEAGYSFTLPLAVLDEDMGEEGEDLQGFLVEVSEERVELWGNIKDVALPREFPDGPLGEFLRNVMWVVKEGFQDRYHVMVSLQNFLIEPGAKRGLRK